MRISDWSSDVCSSDLPCGSRRLFQRLLPRQGQVLMESTVMTTIAEHIRATLPWGVALSVACGSHGSIKTTCPATCLGDRKSVVQGKSVSVRVDHGGRRHIKKKNTRQNITPKK